MRVLEIVPASSSGPGGVAGYAAALDDRLRNGSGLETRLLVIDPRESSAGLNRELAGAEAVFLHYANYGYQRRGCPVGLVRALERWRTSGGKLMTFFHEVYAGDGRPWNSSFWLSSLQRRLAERLARSSRWVLTSLELYARLLIQLAPGVEVHVNPVFSTVGEPLQVPLLDQRLRRLIVFGGAGTRSRAYGHRRDSLETACRTFSIDEVLDVGPALPGMPPSLGGIPIRPLGVLPDTSVSRLLLESFAGFLAYPPQFLPKSTIFAAYCSHGMLPVCSWDDPSRDGAPAAGRHYWTGSGDPQEIATAARDWYAGHSLAKQSETFRNLLAGVSGEA